MYFIHFELQWFRFILDFNRQIQVLKDAIKQSQCSLNIHLDIQQLPDGEEKPALQSRKSDDTAESDSRVGVVNDLQTCYKIDNGWRDRKEDANEHEKPTSYHLLTYFQVGQVLILLLKPILSIFLAPESLRQKDAADGERFLHHGGERCHALLSFFTRCTTHIPYLVGDP